MNIVLIIYLAGIICNIMASICFLIMDYQNGEDITVGQIFKYLLTSCISWATLILIVIYFLDEFSNIVLFRKKNK